MSGEGEASFEKRLTLLEPSVWLNVASIGMLAVGTLLMGAVLYGILAHVPSKGSPAPFAFDMLVFGFLSRLAKNRWRTRKREANVHADARGVTIDGRLAVAKKDIVQGTFQPGITGGSTVRLTGKRESVLFQANVENEAEAIEILHALGLDAGNKRAEFMGAGTTVSQGTRALGVILPMFLGFMLSRIFHLPWLIPVFAIAGIGAVLWFNWPGRIVVGADGILVKTRMKEKFIPMADVRGADPMDERTIGVTLASGETVMIQTTSQTRRQTGFLRARRDAIIARIREARRVFEERGTHVDVSALVGRGERTGGEWIAELKKLRERTANYRDAVLRDEDLWSLLEDPGAAADARAGAAALLRDKLDDEGKARIRVAAEAAASPKLRVALEAAVEDKPEEDLEAALEAVATRDH